MHGVTIAVVEDDTSVREALTSLLQSEGWSVDAYPSGEAFLSELDAKGPPDCLLLDLILTGMSGVDVLQRIARFPLPTVALTAYPSSALASKAHELGIETMLIKPVEPHWLLATLRDVVRNA